MYQVFQGDKPAESKYFPSLKGYGWDNFSFENKREAEVYAFRWAYPVSREKAEADAPHMQEGVAYDYGMSEVPIYMSIRKIK